MKRTATTGLALCLMICVGTSLSAQMPSVSDTVLASNGVVYKARAGQYGALFPDGSEVDSDQHVLTLTISDGHGQQVQQLIPGTEGYEIEVNPSVIFEETTDTLYLLWESWYGVHSRLHLAGFSDNAWTDIIEITGSPYVVQSSPHFAVTRDEVTEYGAKEEQAIVHQRTILHLFWIEERGAGEEKVAYAPQLLLDGQLVSNVTPIILNELVSASENAPAFQPVSHPVMVRPGSDPQSVVVSFTDKDSRQLVTMEMRVLPGELSELSTSVGNWLRSTTAETEPGKLAAAARSMILNSEQGIKSSALIDLADEVGRCVADFEVGTPAAQMAESCTHQILDAGSELDRSGIKKIFGRARPHWIVVGYTPPKGTPNGPNQIDQAQQHVATRITATHPAPEIMELQPASILTSSDGESLIIYWTEETADGQKQVVYQETLGHGRWSAENRLASAAADEEVAVRLLRDRLDSN